MNTESEGDDSGRAGDAGTVMDPKAAQRLAEYARGLAAQQPPISDDVAERAARLLIVSMQEREERGEKSMRWQVELFCGHTIEATAYGHPDEEQSVDAAFRLRSFACPECGKDPVVVVDGARLEPA